MSKPSKHPKTAKFEKAEIPPDPTTPSVRVPLMEGEIIAELHFPSGEVKRSVTRFLAPWPF